MPWMTDADHAQATMMLNVINGARAFTFQNYTEVNVKTGAQRVASAILTVNAGTQNYIGFRTGALPVIIKARLINQPASTIPPKRIVGSRAGQLFRSVTPTTSRSSRS